LHILYLIFKKLSDKVIDGKMCVTNEIKKFESFKNPMITISNGYDNKIFDYPNYQPFDGKNLKILSVCSVLQPWHGLERLFQSVKIWQINNPGLKIELDIVGDFNFSRFDARILPNLVKFHGVKNKDEIIEIAKNSNIAVSSLALYLNNMTEACPLKSREYISIGIPFFYGYDDIDIPSDNIFGLKIPNENNLIEISTILVWLNNIKSNSIKLELDWHFLRKNISWEAKLKKYLDFVMEVQGFK
jgi:hypothetical protein